jgi:hypothetical protein
MKKLIILLAIILAGCGATEQYTIRKKSNKQYLFQFKTTEVLVDKELMFYAREFFDDAFKYGKNVDSLNQGFYGLFVVDIPDGTYGHLVTDTLAGKNHRYVLVDVDALSEENKARFITYHESLHAYYVRHCHYKCHGIMTSVASGPDFYRNWERQKYVFWNQKSHIVQIYYPPFKM